MRLRKRRNRVLGHFDYMIVDTNDSCVTGEFFSMSLQDCADWLKVNGDAYLARNRAN
jgi:hypothetical protein